MAWATPRFSRRQVDRAGQNFIGRIEGDMERSLEIINNWRASHNFPLNTFQVGLRDKARSVEANPLIAQRIKRISSIKAKLSLEGNMQLSRMQDIGGCRAVLQNLDAVYDLRNLYETSKRLRHELVKENDYIANPKISGYRSVHRVYRYVSDRNETYNGLQIEIQIRSQLQHAWATAVETVGTFLEQALKASRGQEDWLRFFTLMGSAIALREGTVTAPGTPTSETELIAELRPYAVALDVETRLTAYHEALHIRESQEMPDAKYYLIELRSVPQTLLIIPYKKQELSEATEEYNRVERQFLDEPGSEAVLVSVESLDYLRRAYPNYFLDTHIFLDFMEEFIS